ncbi:hypothetical protein BDZ97DRAFT_1940255 [Flammula alnicola]|nr:hypothetical protein BDZ97DRAFT_1940255 [Flammula alnicola]
MTTNVELWMPFNDIYRPALSIPVDTCQRFSVHPLTWLRYLGFTIYGNEGHISTLPGGPEVEYYQADIPPGIYYYVSQLPCLLDPAGMDDRTSDASSISINWRNFEERVIARDGNCVMTASRPPMAEVCHIIPHAKGHQYMINLVNHRKETIDPPLNDINDTRNGILLSVALSPAIGACQVAFLQTPNFAMTVNDVDLVAQPNAEHLGFAIQPSIANSRLTFQHFSNKDRVVALLAPHNSDARQSDSNDWPPPLIFDVAYGCVALKTWGVTEFVQFAQEHTKEIYYNYDDNECDRDAPAARQGKVRHVGRFSSDTEDSQEGNIADVVMGLWVLNARKGARQAEAMKAESTREKVRTWLESVE